MPAQQQNPIDALFSAASDLIDFAVPLMVEAYIMSQVIGQILKATNPDATSPPPTYYIGLDPNDPNAPSPPPPDPNANAVIPVAAIGVDSAGGFLVEGGPTHQIFIGSGLAPVATLGLATVNGQLCFTANDTVVCGVEQLFMMGQGSASPFGPVVDQAPDGVHMNVAPMMQGPPGKHTLYNVPGTGGKWDADLTADVAREVNGPRYYWQGVSYPAETFPMGPSVKAGVEELVRLISSVSGTFAIMGYSQGALVTCKLYRDEILNPAGRLHDRKNDIFAHVTYGNPMRAPGWANGNGLMQWPVPGDEFGYQSGGIAGPDDLTPWQTPWWHMDFAKPGDLYATCPTGPDPWANEAPPGEWETAIYKLVMGELAGDESILQQVGEILTDPFGELVPSIMALIDGMQFLGDLGGHGYVECVQASIDWLRDRGNQVPTGS